MNLKETLFQEYNGFADKRIKNLTKNARFIVDDRGPRDFAADKSLFLWFCAIFVDVLAEDEIFVQLTGGVPMSKRVHSWIDKIGASYEQGSRSTLSFNVKRGHEAILVSLAQALEAIVARGSSYPVASYKYVCPRTAKSLRRLEKTLRKSWL